MSPALASTLGRASETASAMGTREVMLEHVLAALCDDPDALPVLDASRVSIPRLKADAEGYLVRFSSGQSPIPGALAVSQDTKRILEAAAAAARGGKRRDINGAIVLAAIVGDGNSVAAQMLQAQGLTFDGAIRALQTALAQPAGMLAVAPQAADDVLARARERVQSRAAPSLKDIMGGLAPASAAPPMLPQFEPVNFEPLPTLNKPVTTPSPQAVEVPVAVSADGSPPKSENGDNNTSAEPSRTSESRVAADNAQSDTKQIDDLTGAPSSDLIKTDDAHRPEPSSVDAASELPRSMPDFRRQAAATPPAPDNVVPLNVPSSATASIAGQVRGAAEVHAPPPAPSSQSLPNGEQGDVLASIQRKFPGFSGPPPIPPPIPGQRSGPAAPPMMPFPGPRTATTMPSLEAQPKLAVPPRTNTGAPVALDRGGSRQRSKPDSGQLAENIPRAMRIGRTERIEIRVAKAAAKSITQGLEGGGVVWKHDIVVTQAMSVRLRAPDGGFFIETVSPETQWVENNLGFSSDDFASWRFLVTPNERGWSRLQIVVSARSVGADGMMAESAMPDQVVEIRVKRDLKRLAMRWVSWIAAAVAGGALAKFGEAGLAVATEQVHLLMKM